MANENAAPGTVLRRTSCRIYFLGRCLKLLILDNIIRSCHNTFNKNRNLKLAFNSSKFFLSFASRLLYQSFVSLYKPYRNIDAFSFSFFLLTPFILLISNLILSRYFIRSLPYLPEKVKQLFIMVIIIIRDRPGSIVRTGNNRTDIKGDNLNDNASA